MKVSYMSPDKLLVLQKKCSEQYKVFLSNPQILGPCGNHQDSVE